MANFLDEASYSFTYPHLLDLPTYPLCPGLPHPPVPILMPPPLDEDIGRSPLHYFANPLLLALNVRLPVREPTSYHRRQPIPLPQPYTLPRGHYKPFLVVLDILVGSVVCNPPSPLPTWQYGSCAETSLSTQHRGTNIAISTTRNRRYGVLVPLAVRPPRTGHCTPRQASRPAP